MDARPLTCPALIAGLHSSISRSRALITQPHGHPDERDEDDEALEDDGNDSDGSFGGKSRMSFSYWSVETPSPHLSVLCDSCQLIHCLTLAGAETLSNPCRPLILA